LAVLVLAPARSNEALTADEVRRITLNTAMLPELLRKPPN
jgi:hypothetical protein